MASRPSQNTNSSNAKKQAAAPAPAVKPAAAPAPAAKPAAVAPPAAPVAAKAPAAPAPAPAPKAAPVAAAPPVGSVSFKADFTQSATGELVAGGKLRLDYELARFSQLMHRGLERGAGWGVKAFVLAQPGGKVQEKELVRFAAGAGAKEAAPQVEAHAFDLPAGTTSVQVWFKAWAADGKRPEAYDSNFGNNFTFAVRAQ